jgi:hypothetical protein
VNGCPPIPPPPPPPELELEELELDELELEELELLPVPDELDEPPPPPPGVPQASQIMCGFSFQVEHPAVRSYECVTDLPTPAAAPKPAARLSMGVAITNPTTAATESAVNA